MESLPIRTIVEPAAATLPAARVLLIDDDAHFRALARKLLEQAGIVLMEAVDARQGLTLIRENADIDAVIVDMVLPDEDGIQTLRRIKKMFPRMKVIAVSGAYTSDFYLGLSACLGADVVLPKSQLDQLRPRIERLLDMN